MVYNPKINLARNADLSWPHYPTHRSGIRNQSSGLISPRRCFARMARKCTLFLVALSDAKPLRTFGSKML
ncbi:MAG TPA: hypothetical protein DEF83_00820 [Brucella melitensis]|nr:hypothetical protein [Brucella melitensis]HCZ30470.1 hypothetical protein [Brucella melitensis]